MKKLFTSESVTEGHPDKVADLISDAILDAYLLQDRESRVACEVLVTSNFVIVSGEVTTNAVVNLEDIIRTTIKEIGYTKSTLGFSYDTVEILIKIDPQSPDIALGVDSTNKEQGAGDQGMMFGYASDETKELMPLGLMLSHQLARQLTKVRKEGIIKGLEPDGKTQVTVEYDEFDVPFRIDSIVVSTQHDEFKSLLELTSEIKKYVIEPVVPKNLINNDTKYYINPTGRFVIGGPAGDTGLTGRKIIVDTYGGSARHGGGAFSGKDPSKVDRSAAYMARYLAKNIVASKIAKKCEIQLSYAIGVANPTSIFIDTFGTAKIPEEKIVEIITSNFDLTPSGIIKFLDLKRPIYKTTSAYGHFGNSTQFITWEKTDHKNLFT